MEYLAGGNVAFNIFYWKITSISMTATGLPPATAVPFGTVTDLIASNVYERWTDVWTNLACGQVEATGCTAQDIWPTPRSRPFTYVPAAPVSGAIVGDMLPMQDSPTLLKQTAYGQRWGLGRTFVVGLPEVSQNAGIINPTYVALLEDLADVFVGPMTVSNATYTIQMIPVLYSQDPPAPPRITEILTGQLSSEVLKTQRRRRPGKGI